jgi:predicted molibdopterin-dependent oxidoreductase YjgC
MRILEHPILGKIDEHDKVMIEFDGKPVEAYEGEPIAAALMASGFKILRYTPKYNEPRGIFCAIGRCTDCMMIVDGAPNIRTCITPVKAGMKIETQHGRGSWD